MKVVSIQPTPNPNAFKFVLDAVVCRGTKNYGDASEAQGHELAEQLFAIEGVEKVFFCDAFITVSMTPDADWRAVHESATRVIEAAEPEEAAITSEERPPVQIEGLSADDAEKLERINELLDDRVRPALAGDGGGLEVIGLEGKDAAHPIRRGVWHLPELRHGHADGDRESAEVGSRRRPVRDTCLICAARGRRRLNRRPRRDRYRLRESPFRVGRFAARIRVLGPRLA